jgi:hypothetical protein
VARQEGEQLILGVDDDGGHPALFAAQGNGLMSAGKARDDNVCGAPRRRLWLQSSTKLVACPGSRQLPIGWPPAQRLQGLAAEAEIPDKAILAAVAQEQAKRNAAAEQWGRTGWLGVRTTRSHRMSGIMCCRCDGVRVTAVYDPRELPACNNGQVGSHGPCVTK